jgi:hypothetical protein
MAREKVDGCLIKRRWSPLEGKFRWSTNKSLDALGEPPDSPLNIKEDGSLHYNTFEELIVATIGNGWAHFDRSYHDRSELRDWTIMWELVSPTSRVVVKYDEPKMYLIGGRNNKTGRESTPEEIAEKFGLGFFDVPQRHDFRTLAECCQAVASFGDNREGLVVQDASFNRVKIKGADYVPIHRLKGPNGLFSTEWLHECIRDNYQDDVRSHFPEMNQALDSMMDTIRSLSSKVKAIISRMENACFQMASERRDERLRRKEFARIARGEYRPISSLLFDLYGMISSSGKSGSDYNDAVEEFVKKLEYAEIESLLAPLDG